MWMEIIHWQFGYSEDIIFKVEPNVLAIPLFWVTVVNLMYSNYSFSADSWLQQTTAGQVGERSRRNCLDLHPTA